MKNKYKITTVTISTIITFVLLNVDLFMSMNWLNVVGSIIATASIIYIGIITDCVIHLSNKFDDNIQKLKEIEKDINKLGL